MLDDLWCNPKSYIYFKFSVSKCSPEELWDFQICCLLKKTANHLSKWGKVQSSRKPNAIAARCFGTLESYCFVQNDVSGYTREVESAVVYWHYIKDLSPISTALSKNMRDQKTRRNLSKSSSTPSNHIIQYQLLNIMHHLNSTLICIVSKRLCNMPLRFLWLQKQRGNQIISLTFYILCINKTFSVFTSQGEGDAQEKGTVITILRWFANHLAQSWKPTVTWCLSTPVRTDGPR